MIPMGPRIEAALVEFARTNLVPPGYAIHNRYDEHAPMSVPIDQPWIVACDGWFCTAATKELACGAAWRHSDRRNSRPATYCIMAAYLVGRREDGGDGWCAVLYEPPTASTLSKYAWVSKKFSTIEDANEAAWDHYERGQQVGSDWDTKIGCHMGEEDDGYAERLAKASETAGIPPGGCVWNVNGELEVRRPAHVRFPMVLGRSTDPNETYVADGEGLTVRIPLDVLRYFLDSLGEKRSL